jgi:hypothetical protein
VRLLRAAYFCRSNAIIIASVGIGPEESAVSWRFVEDPHLFAVFMTAPGGA